MGLRSLPWRDPGFTSFFLAASLGPMCSMALRFVPGHLQAQGASPAVIGDVMALSTLGGVVALPLAGILTARRPRLVMVVGALLQGAGLGLASRGDPSAGALASAVALMSTGTAALDVAVVSTIVSTVAQGRRAELLAYYFAFVNLARNVLGSTLAEQLVLHHGFSTMTRWLALGALAHAGLRLLLPVPHPPAAPARASLRTFVLTLARPRIALLLLVFVLLGTNFAAQESFLGALAVSRELGAITPFFGAYFVVIALGRALVGDRIDRLGRGLIVAMSGLLLAGLGAGLAVVSTPVQLWGLGLVSGLGHLLLWPALYATFYDRVEDRGLVSALLAGALAASGFLAELGLGRLPSYAAIYAAASACALAAGLLVLPLRRSMESTRPTEPT
ncbi:MFS transporter [Paraliomyxa miuraensis]|uniref:MFS transporter n=1 Tax=Paraliomyxa miuraensis TaxID=376150 RepID=UPI0022596B83|nr:MFS transporter [Paraliomyxa miuraensis]MCX4243106.1 MFS transporter [Paraliomyxa miuraensis]